MRILLTVHHKLQPDTGAPGVTLNLASALRGLGHDVEVLGFERVLPRLGDRFDKLLFPIAASSRVARELRRGVFDIVDASTGDLWLLPQQLLAASRTVVVARSHGLEHIAHLARLGAQRAVTSG